MKHLMQFVLLTLSIMVVSSSVGAAEKSVFSTEPTTNNGRKWRISYYEGGPYIDYQQVLTETVKGLMNLGWIESAELPEQTGEETTTMWNWLATKAKSDYIEFLANGHHSANWDEDSRKHVVEKVISRLNDANDVDLMIAMGTWSGKDLANDRHSTPTVVLSASDPLSAGIIKSIDDSGYPYLHATIDPFVYERQIRVFHEIVKFDTLGIAYEDTVDGRSYAAIDKVEKLAAELGFKIERCYTMSDIGDLQKEAASVENCFRQLAKKADAIYVTQQGGVRLETIPGLVAIALKNRIPTFSQAGSEEVKYGFLTSISQAGFRYVGEFHATVIAKIFNGAEPNQLDQAFQQPPKIAINLKTAEIIGFNPPILLLGAADEIFTDIAMPKR